MTDILRPAPVVHGEPLKYTEEDNKVQEQNKKEISFIGIPTTPFRGYPLHGEFYENTWCSNPETDALVSMVYWMRPKSILEIGTNDGITTNNLATAARVVEKYPMIFTIDFGDKDNKDKIEEVQLTEVRKQSEVGKFIHPHVRQYVKQIFGDSTQLDWQAACGIPMFDMQFLDGGHSYKVVKDDFEKAKKLCSKNGFIMFHDIWWDFASPPVSGPLTLAKENRDIMIVNGTHLGVWFKSGIPDFLRY